MPPERRGAGEAPVASQLAGGCGLQRAWGPRLQPRAGLPWVEIDPHGHRGAAPSTGRPDSLPPPALPGRVPSQPWYPRPGSLTVLLVSGSPPPHPGVRSQPQLCGGAGGAQRGRRWGEQASQGRRGVPGWHPEAGPRLWGH